MKKPLDRISEAYHDELGTKFGKKVRDRIHWVANQVKGQKVLDVGCSQGILPIILGRVGKEVLGIDILEESIAFANKALEKEEKSTKDLVSFKLINFITHDFGVRKYDTIVFGEVLEHVTNPNEFVKKADTILNEEGRIIITVPFGINDYFDHKRTYYLSGLYDLVEKSFNIAEIKFFGKWIAIILEKQDNNQTDNQLNIGMLQRLEESFEGIEREWMNTNEKLKKKIYLLEKEKEENLLKIKRYEEEQQNEILKTLKENNQLMRDLKSRYNVGSDQESTNLRYSSEDNLLELQKTKQVLIDEKKEKIQFQKKLMDAYKNEEMLLKSYKKLISKYEALSRSKLGRLTIKYWNVKKRMHGGKKSE
ncbi:2-polyprenyl-6-hydroxyphenyl methylase/3-demethylubiquinone-9 3-methyltransferase [Bacillus pakistanensis]|uniref:2-polyprenyl-6-hydroxyphenyl methylase/3-demethylubiquinone-9 3-methyltransferase n=1 Tax=Rossellomorea pakistanensis TaxID=992288 RepID=A0ABS2ND21_9BACI|nr:methyltransferase domain-containing protein [Bacillus pakistanensis]MBM7585757.1 2-polyprenyl-6-hydroxyphenyl methylase/3-demethylubiquinone-9 3-methyltransferase [Bacillus pakistanensis]